MLAEASRRAGPRLACRAGCTECCHGPFPINALDALRLRAGLAELGDCEPERAVAVVERARAQVADFALDYPGDAATGALSEDDAAADAFFTRWAALPCPALDAATGCCELYGHRPLTCRTFGPPVAIGGVDLAPCRLCFVGSSAEEIEACRVEPDPEALEDRILACLDSEAGETVIAYALAVPGSGGR